MKFTRATVLAFAALSMAAPAFDEKLQRREMEKIVMKLEFIPITNIRELSFTIMLMLLLLLMLKVTQLPLKVLSLQLLQLLKLMKPHLLQLMSHQLLPLFLMNL